MCSTRWNTINWNNCEIYKCIKLDLSRCFCSYWQNKLKIYRNKFWSFSTGFRQLMMNIVRGIISFSSRKSEIYKTEFRVGISHGMMSWVQCLWMFPGDEWFWIAILEIFTSKFSLHHDYANQFCFVSRYRLQVFLLLDLKR